MRDSTILNQFDAMAGAVAADNANLQTSVILLRTRIDALELMLLADRFGLLKAVFWQIFSPKILAFKVQLAHQEQIRRFNLMRQEANVNRPKIKPAPPVGIIKP